MARRQARPAAQREVRLTPLREQCVSCGERLWVAYHAQRTLMTFRGLVRLRLVVRRCRNAECALYHVPYRAEEEGAWALPHGEFGLDIITVIGQLRYGEHRSIPEIHQRLESRGVSIAPRTVTDLLERYEELVALHLADEERLQERLKQQVRGVRPIERALEGREDEQSQAIHGYCLAVRSSLTDDGRPPLCASGLKLHDRLIQISDSLARVEEKRGAFLRN